MMNLENIHTRNLRMFVIGSGYVGLPTAALFATAGFNVIAVDIKSRIVDCVNGGTSPIDEPGLQELVSSNVQAGKLKAALASDMILSQDDVVILSVQTPIVEKTKKPNLSFLLGALETVGKNLKKRMLIVICSTIPPGTIHKVKPLLESLSGLKAETDFTWPMCLNESHPEKRYASLLKAHDLLEVSVRIAQKLLHNYSGLFVNK
jgi:UDP-N-acetyl-D-mannosaminuronic acid dehydrogenase